MRLLSSYICDFMDVCFMLYGILGEFRFLLGLVRGVPDFEVVTKTLKSLTE